MNALKLKPSSTPSSPSVPKFKEAEAFERAYRSYRIDGIKGVDPDGYFKLVENELIELINRELKDLRSARVQTTTWIKFIKEDEVVELAFNSRMTDFFTGSDTKSLVEGMINHMKEQIENPGLMNSKFVFDEVLFMDSNFHRVNLTRGGSYLPLPEFIQRKKAVINPQNDDFECFKWAVIASLHNSDIKFNPERVSNLKKFESNYDWLDLSFPTSLKKIKKFEFRNEITVKVLGLEGKDIYICRKGMHANNYKEVNLL